MPESIPNVRPRVSRRRQLLVCFALLWPAACFAQEDAVFHSCTVDLGGAWVQPAGVEHQSLQSTFRNFQAGGGFALTGPPEPGHPLQLFLTADFLFDKPGIQPSALQQARILNPTDVGLLQATGGTANFYTATLNLTVRIPVGRADVYFLGGFGWMRRSLEFTGPSGAGNLLQPASPLVFGSGGDSGAFDAGAGIETRLPKAKGLMLYLEARVLHGLAINHETTLVPISFGVRY